MHPGYGKAQRRGLAFALAVLLLPAVASAQNLSSGGPASTSLGNYEAIIKADAKTKPHCPDMESSGIVVCAHHRPALTQRLPLYADEKDERDGARGNLSVLLAPEHVHCGPTSCDPPNRQMETIHRLWQAATGSDAD